MDYESNIKILKLLVSHWHEVKEDLFEGKVKYNDLEKLIKDYKFFDRFENMFKETYKFFEIPLSDVKLMIKGVKGEVDLNDYGRMIPDPMKIKTPNRMSPTGVAFLYVGIIGEDKGRDRKTVRKHIIRTCLKELRSTKNSKATICEFQIHDSSKQKKIFNICGDPNIPMQDGAFLEYYKKHVVNRNGTGNKEKISKISAKYIFNTINSDKIFKPVETDDITVREHEYAPFQALANYINKAGYAGMMYRSTVHTNGTNLVLFNTDDASIVPDSMEHVMVSNYL